MIHQANHLHMLGCNPWWKSWKVGKRWYKIHPNTSRVTTYDEVTTKHKAGVCSRSLLTTFQNGPKGALGRASHKSYAPNTASKSYHKEPSATKTLEPISPIGTYWNHSSRPQRSAASPAFFKPPASRTPANNLPCASRHPDMSRSEDPRCSWQMWQWHQWHCSCPIFLEIDGAKRMYGRPDQKKQHARIDGPASAEPTILGAHLMDVANAIRPRKGRWNYTVLYTSVIISSSVKFQHLLNLLALLPVSSAEILGCSPNWLLTEFIESLGRSSEPSGSHTARTKHSKTWL